MSPPILIADDDPAIRTLLALIIQRTGLEVATATNGEEALNKLADELGGARVIVADLSRAGEPERLAKEAGEIDVLVSNAGIPATGRTMKIAYAHIDRVVNGKIVELHIRQDDLGMLQQLGVIPMPGSAPA